MSSQTSEPELNEISLNDTNVEISEPNSNFIVQYLNEKKNDQDCKQLMNVIFTLILELYRVLMGAFLVVFVPQKCNDNICSMTENINRSDIISRLAISANLLTFLIFITLYVIEVRRENKLIKYLEVNRFTPVDNESVGEALTKLDDKRKTTILNYDRYYRNGGYLSTFGFILNTVLSLICIFNNYLGSKTLTVLLTNVLFMGMKVSDVFSIVNTKKNVFYSAYLTNKVQFNDVDPDKVLNNSV